MKLKTSVHQNLKARSKVTGLGQLKSLQVSAAYRKLLRLGTAGGANSELLSLLRPKTRNLKSGQEVFRGCAGRGACPIVVTFDLAAFGLYLAGTFFEIIDPKTASKKEVSSSLDRTHAPLYI